MSVSSQSVFAISVRLMNNFAGLTEWTPPNRQNETEGPPPSLYKNLRVSFTLGRHSSHPLHCCTLNLPEGIGGYAQGTLHYTPPHPFISWFRRSPDLFIETSIDEYMQGFFIQTHRFMDIRRPIDNDRTYAIPLGDLEFEGGRIRPIVNAIVEISDNEFRPPANTFFLTRWINAIIELLFDFSG